MTTLPTLHVSMYSLNHIMLLSLFKGITSTMKVDRMIKTSNSGKLYGHGLF